MSKQIVAAVDYHRLVPEHPFPAGFDDCCSAFLWMREHAEAYGGNPLEMYCAGDSAGGNLAAALALRIHEQFGEQYVAGLMLFYPVVSLIPGDYGESWKEFSHGYALDADLMSTFCEAYVSVEMQENSSVSPLRSTKLACLPQTLCITAGCDILRDQGRIFCKQLRNAGVLVREITFFRCSAFVRDGGRNGDGFSAGCWGVCEFSAVVIFTATLATACRTALRVLQFRREFLCQV